LVVSAIGPNVRLAADEVNFASGDNFAGRP
jgi:hypothetical protein